MITARDRNRNWGTGTDRPDRPVPSALGTCRREPRAQTQVRAATVTTVIRRWCSRRSRVVTALVIVLVGVFGPATTAFAHSALVAAQPGPGEILATAPSVVELRFNETVVAGPSSIRVLDAAGRRVDSGRTEQTEGGVVLTTSLRASGASGSGLANGTYVVVWRVTSPDGHPIQGAYTFSVGSPSISGAASEALVDRYLAQSGSSVALGVVLAIARAMAFAGLALLIGVIIAITSWGSAVIATRSCARVVYAGVGLAAIGTALALLGQGSYSAGLALGDIVRLDLLSDVLGTRYGLALAVRLGVIGVGALWWWWARSAPTTVSRRTSAAVIVLALALTISFAGHAATGPMPIAGVLLDVVHIIAMAAWVGGLVLLVTIVLRKEPVQWEAVSTFSRLALVAFIVIALSGTAQGWRQLGSVAALTDTAYGQALIVKVMVVACVLPLAAYARELLRRRTDESAVVAAAASDHDGDLEPDSNNFDDTGVASNVAARRLRRSVSVELAFLAVVLAVTAVLVNTVPGREAIAAPAFVQMSDAKVRIEGTIAPAALGPNDVHLSAYTPEGIPFDVNAMTARLERSDIGALEIPLRRLAPGHYYSPRFVIPRKGKWALVVTTDVDAFTRNTQQTSVTIR